MIDVPAVSHALHPEEPVRSRHPGDLTGVARGQARHRSGREVDDRDAAVPRAPDRHGEPRAVGRQLRRLHPAVDAIGRRAVQQDRLAPGVTAFHLQPDHPVPAQEDDRRPVGCPLRGVAVPGEEPLTGAVHVHDVHVPRGGIPRAHVVALAAGEEDASSVRGEPGEELDLRGVREAADGPGAQVEEIELVVARPVRGPDHEPVEPPGERVDRVPFRGRQAGQPDVPRDARREHPGHQALGQVRHGLQRVRQVMAHLRQGDRDATQDGDGEGGEYEPSTHALASIARGAARLAGRRRGGGAIRRRGVGSAGRASPRRRRRRAASPPSARGTPPPSVPRPTAGIPRRR